MKKLHFEKWYSHIEKKHRQKLTPYQIMALMFSNVEKLGSVLIENGIEPDQNVTFNIYNSIMNFCRAGRQAFEIGPELCEQFAATDLSNVTAEHVRMPYSAFYLSIPEGTAQIWGGSRTRFHDVEGVYVSENHKTKNLMLVIFGAANERSRDDLDDGVVFIKLNICKMKQDDQNFQDYVEKTLSKVLTYEPSNFLDDPTDVLDSENLKRSGLLRKHTDDCIRVLARIVVNSILYISSPKSEIETDEDRERDSIAIETLCKNETRLKPGKLKKLATKISKRKKTRLSQLAPTLEKELTEKTRAGFWVRGHWQIYWTGEGRKTQTPVFKLPFKSGKIDDSQKIRAYEVQPDP